MGSRELSLPQLLGTHSLSSALANKGLQLLSEYGQDSAPYGFKWYFDQILTP